MKLLPILIVLIALIGLGAIIYFIYRQPTTREDSRALGHDAERGLRDATNATKDAVRDGVNATKDAAQDAKEKVQDATK